MVLTDVVVDNVDDSVVVDKSDSIVEVDIDSVIVEVGVVDTEVAAVSIESAEVVEMIVKVELSIGKRVTAFTFPVSILEITPTIAKRRIRYKTTGVGTDFI